MTSDDQHFLDLLSAIPNDVKRYSLEVADAIDRGVDQAAIVVRKTLSSFEWIPESARPRPPDPPPVQLRAVGHQGIFNAAKDWVWEHRALSAAVVAFTCTGGILLYRQRKAYLRKRRVKRAGNGARTEAVVIAGSPNSPVTKSLSLDLERRGFIVYVVCGTAEEEQQVKNEARADVRPLYLNITNPLDAGDSISGFRQSLSKSHSAWNSPSLRFTGLIVIPDLTYPAGPVEAMDPELWSDMLNARVLGTIVTTQVFLSLIREYKARVLVMTPSVVPSLQPPFHSVESAVVGALQGFTSSLSGEMATMGIDVCLFKLGAFNCAKDTPQRSRSPREADVMSWPPSTRAAYGQNYFSQCDGLRRHHALACAKAGTAGSSLRELNNAVFDALTERRPKRVWRVGRGSLLYDVVGAWVPSGIVGWMMGVRGLSAEEMDKAQTPGSVQSLQWEKVENIV